MVRQRHPSATDNPPWARITISLPSTYVHTLDGASNVRYEWTANNSSYVRVSSKGYESAEIIGLRPTSSCKVYFNCSYEIRGFYRTMDFYFEIEVISKVTRITLDPSSANLDVGETLHLIEKVFPDDATNKSVNWSSSNKNVAKVNYDGDVTAISPGTANITCRANDGSGEYATCKITVNSSTIGVTGITLNKSLAELYVGNTLQLSATVSPDNATNKNVSWNCSNTSIADVSSAGLVTARATGSATITCTAKDGSGVSATCKITVSAKENLTLTASPAGGEIEKGKTVTLKANVNDASIYYTTDGTTPSKSSTKYTSAIPINSDVTIKAIAYHNDYTTSDVLTVKYTIKETAADEFTIDGITYKIENGDATLVKGKDVTGNLNIPSQIIYNGKKYSVTKIGASAFQSCRDIESIVMPSSIVEIGSFAFSFCASLTNVNIPNGVISIATGTFYYCSSLTSMNIPTSVKTIGYIAFGDSEQLKSVRCYWSSIKELQINGEAFSSIHPEAKLIVPKGSKSIYQSTKPWSDFKYIEEESGDNGDDPDDGTEDNPEIGTDTDLSKYNDAIYFDKAETQSGTSITLSLKMKNKTKVSGLQANIYMPEGVTISKVQRGDGLKVRDENDEYVYTFGSSKKDDGSHFILSYSTSDIPMSAGTREIAKVTIDIAEGVKSGDYPMIVKNIEMAFGSENVKEEEIRTTLKISDYVLGDANSDGTVSVTDITSIGSYLMDNNKPINKVAADANKDGVISVTDITLIGKMLFNNTKAAIREFIKTRTSEGTADIELSNGNVTAGENVTIPVTMTGQASAFQFDVYLPEGVSIHKVQRGSLLKATDDNEEYIFTYQGSPMNDGEFYRVVAYNTSNTPTAEAGEVIKLVLSTDDSLVEGEYEIQLKGIECGMSGVVLSTYKETSAKLTVGGGGTAIDFVNSGNKVSEIFNLFGMKVTEPIPGQTYIYKYADGSTVKRVAK